MELLAEAAERWVTFHFAAHPESRVFVTGTFNNWSHTAHPLRDNPNSGRFKTTILLPTGRHEYKFVVDGVWQSDPDCPDCVPNAFGSMNSVIIV